MKKKFLFFNLLKYQLVLVLLMFLVGNSYGESNNSSDVTERESVENSEDNCHFELINVSLPDCAVSGETFELTVTYDYYGPTGQYLDLFDATGITVVGGPIFDQFAVPGSNQFVVFIVAIDDCNSDQLVSFSVGVIDGCSDSYESSISCCCPEFSIQFTENDDCGVYCVVANGLPIDSQCTVYWERYGSDYIEIVSEESCFEPTEDGDYYVEVMCPPNCNTTLGPIHVTCQDPPCICALDDLSIVLNADIDPCEQTFACILNSQGQTLSQAGLNVLVDWNTGYDDDNECATWFGGSGTITAHLTQYCGGHVPENIVCERDLVLEVECNPCEAYHVEFQESESPCGEYCLVDEYGVPIDASYPNDIRWYLGSEIIAGGNCFIPNQSGSYSVYLIIYDTNGAQDMGLCQNHWTFEVNCGDTSPCASYELVVPTDPCGEYCVTTSAPNNSYIENIQWSMNGEMVGWGSCFTPSQSGNYVVHLSLLYTGNDPDIPQDSGCQKEWSFSVNCKGGGFEGGGIKSSEVPSFSRDIFSYYPNPITGDVLFINREGKTLDDQMVTYQIIDATGKLVLSGTFAQQSMNQIKVTSMEVGLYFIFLKTK